MGNRKNCTSSSFRQYASTKHLQVERGVGFAFTGLAWIDYIMSWTMSRESATHNRKQFKSGVAELCLEPRNIFFGPMTVRLLWSSRGNKKICTRYIIPSQICSTCKIYSSFLYRAASLLKNEIFETRSLKTLTLVLETIAFYSRKSDLSKILQEQQCFASHLRPR